MYRENWHGTSILPYTAIILQEINYISCLSIILWRVRTNAILALLIVRYFYFFQLDQVIAKCGCKFR